MTDDKKGVITLHRFEKNDLEKIPAIKAEIGAIRDEMRHGFGETVKDSVRGSSDTFPYTEHTFSIEGVCTQKGYQLQKKLNNKLDELQNLLLEMENWLEEIDDLEMRAILRMKYRNGLTQEQIAGELGYSRSAIAVKIHRFFQNG